MNNTAKPGLHIACLLFTGLLAAAKKYVIVRVENKIESLRPKLVIYLRTREEPTWDHPAFTHEILRTAVSQPIALLNRECVNL